jgi:hypothetical protein
VTFRNDFSDHNIADLTSFIRKHNAYATREAIDVLTSKYKLTRGEEYRTTSETDRNAASRRHAKKQLYNHLPLWCGPISYFIYRYAFQFGFLDGREGVIYHFLQGFWYRFLVSVKVVEFDRILRCVASAEGRGAELARLSGRSSLDLTAVNKSR